MPCDASALQACIDAARQCVLDSGLADLQEGYSTQVLLVYRSWNGTRPGLGTPTDLVYELAPRPFVLAVPPSLTGGPAGASGRGDQFIKYVSLSYGKAQLMPNADHDEVFFLLNGDPYHMDGEPVKRGLGWSMRVTRRTALNPDVTLPDPIPTTIP